MRLGDLDALKDHLEDLQSYTALGKEHAYYRGETNALKIAIRNVENAPTIDAVPVEHGAWEEETVDSYEENAVIADWQSARCSVCKQYLTTPYMYYFEHYNYCPNCGAKMSAKEDGEC